MVYQLPPSSSLPVYQSPPPSLTSPQPSSLASPLVCSTSPLYADSADKIPIYAVSEGTKGKIFSRFFSELLNFYLFYIFVHRICIFDGCQFLCSSFIGIQKSTKLGHFIFDFFPLHGSGVGNLKEKKKKHLACYSLNIQISWILDPWTMFFNLILLN